MQLDKEFDFTTKIEKKLKEVSSINYKKLAFLAISTGLIMGFSIVGGIFILKESPKPQIIEKVVKVEVVNNKNITNEKPLDNYQKNIYLNSLKNLNSNDIQNIITYYQILSDMNEAKFNEINSIVKKDLKERSPVFEINDLDALKESVLKNKKDTANKINFFQEHIHSLETANITDNQLRALYLMSENYKNKVLLTNELFEKNLLDILNKTTKRTDVLDYNNIDLKIKNIKAETVKNIENLKSVENTSSNKLRK